MERISFHRKALEVLRSVDDCPTTFNKFPPELIAFLKELGKCGWRRRNFHICACRLNDFPDIFILHCSIDGGKKRLNNVLWRIDGRKDAITLKNFVVWQPRLCHAL